MAIRLVAVDLDDTLLNEDLAISPRSRRAIARAQKAGIAVVLATGRMFPSARPYALSLGLTGPLITYNGAMIKTAAGNLWWHRPVPRDVALEVLDWAQSAGGAVQCYLDDRLCVPRITEEVRYYTEIAGIPAQAVGDMRRLLSEGEPTKMLSVGSPEAVRAWEADLKARFGPRLAVTISKPRFVEMLRPGVSKASALAEVARRLGVDRGDVLAIGDSFNDLEMLDWAGVGVAMGNAPPEVQAAADHVVRSNVEEGVAEAIERFVLN
ncbi:MAG: HAD family phosphatase [Firmicutes bacterium]|nr:HAD family phosphatase [Bacillota bacterium]